jgi:murein DD-endopeptidase MepM/ murein hydrolase activator NlpD
MNTSLRRVLAACLLVSISLVVVAAVPGEALAADDDFVMVYFPGTDVTTHFTNDWGSARSGGRGHQGTDIFSPKLSPVLAVADGFVERIKDGDRSGYYVLLRHAGGWESYYMHLNNDTPGTDDGRGGLDFAVAPGIEDGEFVPAGTVIGYAGDSGNAEWASPHTHFELHRDGRPVNPYPYLAAAWERQLRVWELAKVLD